MEASKKSRFTGVIAGLTLLMIAGLSACIIMLILMSVDDISFDKVMVFVLGLAVTVISLRTIVKQNQSYSQQRVDMARNGGEAVLTQWEIDKTQWTHFCKSKYESDINESSGYGWSAACLMGLVSGFSLWNRFDLGQIVAFVLLIAGVFFFIGKYVAGLKARSDFKRQCQLEVADIHFARSSIIFNSRLILLNELGYRLKDFSIQDKFNMKVIIFTVESGVGSRKSSSGYTIPMPADKMEEANQLSSYYNGIA
ncbi:hypothetical protein [Roseivirga echinicomitans]|uniref:DUF304 domain-containing protein n=1 Tax=Roseivirga echinicomitans TaxID=296218 RepID=A0A150XJX8_9BACT|nr:hypothetical protein [Roseivirga echinicomitans]KYG78981.1 hypothetical protein AWN68_04950 [Roseivirga echinicomitans]